MIKLVKNELIKAFHKKAVIFLAIFIALFGALVYFVNKSDLDNAYSSEQMLADNEEYLKNLDLTANVGGNVAEAQVKKDKAIVTIICDASRSSEILAESFAALKENGINVQMISQGASKVNISVLVDQSQVDQTVTVLHKALFK